MKIGYFTDLFPYQNPITGNILKPSFSGGTGEAVYNLTVQMAKRGHEVYVFTTACGEGDSLSRYGNISITRHKPNFTVGQSGIALRHLIEPLISSVDLDIVHLHTGGLPASVGGIIHAKKKNAPLISTHHADPISGFGTPARRAGIYLYSHLCSYLLSKSDKIIVPSKSYATASNYLKKHQYKTIIIPNGLDMQTIQTPLSKRESRATLNLSSEKKILLFVGSLYPHKGINVLIWAMPTIAKQHPDVLLLVGGKGIIEDELKQLTKELGLQNNIQFLGHIIGELKSLYYKASDIFVLPSLTESFGIVNLEAMANGLPIVASNVGGVPDIVKDGTNGLLATPGDPDDFAKKILSLCNSKTLRNQFGMTGKALSKEYSWETIADKTESVYLSLI